MKRRMLALATTTVLAGWATAQSPMNLPATNVPAPATGKDAALEPGVVLLRTANQPDRKVKVVKSTKQADGRVVTEVMDIKTGETLYVADKAPGGKTDTASPAMKVPSTVATPAVTMPAVDKTPSASAISMPLSTSSTATPVTEKKPVTDLPTAKPRENDPLLNGAKTSTPISTKSLKSTPTTVSQKSPMTIPSTVADKATPAMPTTTTATMATTPAKDNAPIHVVLPVGYVPAEFRMKEETAKDVAALQSASRPSVRQDAATALAEGRYASRMEVKAVLAGAAMHDPAEVVRAHCIQSLSKLGYNSPEYIGYLRQCSVDSSSEVKAAAADALSKLEPKK